VAKAEAVVKIPDFTVAERAAKNASWAEWATNMAVPLKEGIFAEPMETYWAFTGAGSPEGEYHRLVNVLGWQPCHASWLTVEPEQAGWNRSPEGYVVKGERGDHCLLLQPKRLYWQRKRAESDANLANVRSWRNLQKRAQEDAGDGPESSAIAKTHLMAFDETKETHHFDKNTGREV
jgi:hypothetical protein